MALLWAARARRPEVEEALRPLDGHRTSLELESFILTKLTKPSVPVNLVGPQVSLPPWWVPASRGGIHFLCVIRSTSGGSELTTRGTFFSRNTLARPVGPSSQGGNVFFAK